MERNRCVLVLVLASVLFGLASGPGCGSGDGDGDADADGDSDGDGDSDADADGPDADADDGSDGGPPTYAIEDVTVEWRSCSLHDGEDDGRAECASTAMPLFWDAPDGRTIEIEAKRLLGTGDAPMQLWLIPGGPGASGTVMHPASMEYYQSLLPGLDVYTLDHRGTGYSGFLGCPDQESETSAGGTRIVDSEWDACFDYLRAERGDELEALTASASAVDLAAYIHATAEPDRQVFVFGGSYGSYLVQRYLAIFPDQADGAIIAGIMPADGTIITSDEDANVVGQNLLALCAADELCASHLGSDPWAFLGEALDRLDSRECTSVGIDSRTFKLLLFYALYYFPMNSTVPALIYRLHRCTPEDNDAIGHLTDYLFGDSGFWTTLHYSILLQFHVMFSEMWESDDFADVDLNDYFTDLAQTVRVGRNQGPSRWSLRRRWPLYVDEYWDDAWAETEIPMLMLQGMLDPATAHARAQRAGEHFAGAHQHFVAFPEASHSVLSGTPVSADPEELHCATLLLLDFLADPEAELDTSCVDDVLPIDFGGTAEIAATYFGTDDLWELAP